MTDCLFCGIVAGTVPSEIVHETETTLAFKDISPAAPLHVLVIPKRHITDASEVVESDGPVLADMLLAARAVAEQAGVAGPDRGYRLIFNVGPDSMNTIPHLHLHVLGGQPLKGHFALA
ncbi:MAG TPA: histidine triad nucleotide-binding protein [Acidimicrobiales bacterium]|jgi:histidine triad (HIT) family protein|nr:histidine triad nucleotide-binding protein [Acidimicrobiales bacterium]